MTANCASEGPNGDCGWIEAQNGIDIVSNQASSPGGYMYLAADTDTDTLAQYAAARLYEAASRRYWGPSIRGTGGAGAGDCHYVFRLQTTSGYRLRTCKAGSSCGTNYQFSTGGADFTTWASGDSLGISSDDGTGDDVVITVWKFDSQSPPTDFADWDTYDSDHYSVCASGCDKTWTTAPSAANCTADNKRLGIYTGGGTTRYDYDDWVGGDTVQAVVEATPTATPTGG